MPFGVVVDALDAHLSAHDEEAVREWDPAALEELAAIFPSLRRHVPDAPSGLGE